LGWSPYPATPTRAVTGDPSASFLLGSLDSPTIQRESQGAEARSARPETYRSAPGARPQELGPRSSVPGARYQELGTLVLGPGARSSVPGARYQELGPWPSAPWPSAPWRSAPWCSALVLGSLVLGSLALGSRCAAPWCVVRGAWCVVRLGRTRPWSLALGARDTDFVSESKGLRHSGAGSSPRGRNLRWPWLGFIEIIRWKTIPIHGYKNRSGRSPAMFHVKQNHRFPNAENRDTRSC